MTAVNMFVALFFVLLHIRADVTEGGGRPLFLDHSVHFCFSTTLYLENGWS